MFKKILFLTFIFLHVGLSALEPQNTTECEKRTDVARLLHNDDYTYYIITILITSVDREDIRHFLEYGYTTSDTYDTTVLCYTRTENNGVTLVSLLCEVDDDEDITIGIQL